MQQSCFRDLNCNIVSLKPLFLIPWKCLLSEINEKKLMLFVLNRWFWPVIHVILKCNFLSNCWFLLFKNTNLVKGDLLHVNVLIKLLYIMLQFCVWNCRVLYFVWPQINILDACFAQLLCLAFDCGFMFQASFQIQGQSCFDKR